MSIWIIEHFLAEKNSTKKKDFERFRLRKGIYDLEARAEFDRRV